MLTLQNRDSSPVYRPHQETFLKTVTITIDSCESLTSAVSSQISSIASPYTNKNTLLCGAYGQWNLLTLECTFVLYVHCDVFSKIIYATVNIMKLEMKKVTCRVVSEKEPTFLINRSGLLQNTIFPSKEEGRIKKADQTLKLSRDIIYIKYGGHHQGRNIVWTVDDWVPFSITTMPAA